MPDRLSATARLVGTLSTGPAPVVSIKREGQILTATVVWCEPIAERTAGAQLLLLAAAAEVASEGRAWKVAVESPPTPMTEAGWRWGSLVLVPSTGTDAEYADARLALDTALRDLVGRVQHA